MTHASPSQTIVSRTCQGSACVSPATMVAKAEGHQFIRAALCSEHYVKEAAEFRALYDVLGLKLVWKYVNGSNPASRLRTMCEIEDARRELRTTGLPVGTR